MANNARVSVLVIVSALSACGGATASQEGVANQPPSLADAGPSDDSATAAPDAEPPPKPTPELPAAPSGTKIDAPPRTWTWVPFPEAKCMDGSPTGIGIDPGSSRDVLIVLEGGGACFDDATCTVGTIHRSFDHPTFDAVIAAMGNSGILNRTLPDNPFADFSFVFVPYCTGDVHAGNNPAGRNGAHYVGYENIGVYLRRVVPTFPDAARVVIAGSSAGGIGAAYNFDRTQSAFGKVPVTLLDDSGPVLPDDYLKPCLQKQFRETWNLDATMPADCADCRPTDGGGMINVAKHLARKYPDRKFGMISSTQDAVIRTFFSFGYSADCRSPGYFPPLEFEAGLDALQSMGATLSTHFHVFYPRSEMHTWLLTDAQMQRTVAGVPLHAWMRDLIDGGASFRDATE